MYRILWGDSGWRGREGIAAKEGKKEESGLLALSPTCVLTPDFALLACSGLQGGQSLECKASRGSADGLSALMSRKRLGISSHISACCQTLTSPCATITAALPTSHHLARNLGTS